MSTRQLSIGDFAAHCLDEIKSVEDGSTVLEILGGNGEVIAVVDPGSQGLGLTGASGRQGIGPNLVAEDAALNEDFWQTLTADRQAWQQNVTAGALAGSLLGGGTEEEWAGFDEALEQWRAEQPLQPLAPHAA